MGLGLRGHGSGQWGMDLGGRDMGLDWWGCESGPVGDVDWAGRDVDLGGGGGAWVGLAGTWFWPSGMWTWAGEGVNRAGVDVGLGWQRCRLGQWVGWGYSPPVPGCRKEGAGQGRGCWWRTPAPARGLSLSLAVEAGDPRL